MSIRDYNKESFVYEYRTNSIKSFLDFKNELINKFKNYDIHSIKLKVEIEAMRKIGEDSNIDNFP